MEEQYQEIDFTELLRKLIKSKKFIIRWALAAFVLGLVVALSIPKSYTVKSILAPEFNSRASAGLAQIINLSGYNMARQGTIDAVYPDLYPEVINSIPFIADLFNTNVSFTVDKKEISCDYYTYLHEYRKSPWWSAVIAAPFKAIGWLISLFKEECEAIESDRSINPNALTAEQEAMVSAARKSISINVDKKTFLVSLSVTAQDPNVATRILEVIIEKLQDYISTYRTEKVRKDLEFYEQVYEEAKAAYYTAQQHYADYVDANQGVVLQKVLTERSRLQDEMQLSYSLYTACAQQLQTAKVKVQQETPVCAVINPPTRPTRPSAPSKIKLIFIFVFLSLAISMTWVLGIKDWLVTFKNGAGDDKDQRSES